MVMFSVRRVLILDDLIFIMTEDQLKLLFTDISGRVGRGLQVETPDGIDIVTGVDIYCGVKVEINGRWYKFDEIKPILRTRLNIYETEEFTKKVRESRNLSLINKFIAFDYLDEHMYDYRGLVSQGLAKSDNEHKYIRFNR